MHATNNPELCPVKLWASTIYRIHSYPVFDPHWPVCTLFNGNITNITSLDVIKIISSSVRSIGKGKLCFTENGVGTHSNRTSAAMTIYLANVLVFTIMIIGRWLYGHSPNP